MVKKSHKAGMQKRFEAMTVARENQKKRIQQRLAQRLKQMERAGVFVPEEMWKRAQAVNKARIAFEHSLRRSQVEAVASISKNVAPSVVAPKGGEVRASREVVAPIRGTDEGRISLHRGAMVQSVPKPSSTTLNINNHGETTILDQSGDHDDPVVKTSYRQIAPGRGNLDPDTKPPSVQLSEAKKKNGEAESSSEGAPQPKVKKKIKGGSYIARAGDVPSTVTTSAGPKDPVDAEKEKKRKEKREKKKKNKKKKKKKSKSKK
eukprot:g271.t1